MSNIKYPTTIIIIIKIIFCAKIKFYIRFYTSTYISSTAKSSPLNALRAAKRALRDVRDVSIA